MLVLIQLTRFRPWIAANVELMIWRLKYKSVTQAKRRNPRELSLSPPLILFSLARTASTLRHFQQALGFSVNILAHSQESLSNRFARPSTASWEEAAYAEGENGCALFADTLAQLECSRYAEIDGGDHLTFFGEVTQIHLGRPGDPLLFYRGRYGTYVGSRFDKLPPPDGSLSDFAVTGWG